MGLKGPTNSGEQSLPFAISFHVGIFFSLMKSWQK
jgi:hypothetical protein